MLAPLHAGAANCSAAPINGELYSIANQTSAKVLDITGGSTQAGAAVQQWGYGTSANQKFYVRDAGNGAWTSTRAKAASRWRC
ncbi:MAG: RICIN domain-containing protein [Massilia sp.]